MFDFEIEKKIVKFVKESPIGVTSSEIARYLNVNRMTITKYLAVIKEKALIDFKQLGMAKLWYVPVDLNKENFLNKLVIQIAANSDDKKAIKSAASKMADHIVELYKGYYGIDKLNFDQVVEAIEDAQEKIGGKAEVIEKADKHLTLKCTKCPFGDNVKLCRHLCYVTSNILGKLASKNLGYAKVNIKKAIAQGADHCLVEVYLKEGKEEGKEFR
ncbi:HTH domain-containing protein [Candidatus Woesearchaeota archaeon]|nr:HTH domain-containing protein [Candidatus Woesearchaeota archaeon]